MNKKNVLKWIVALIGGAIGIAILLVLIAFGSYAVYVKLSEPRPIKFDSLQWKNVPQNSIEDTRYRMHKDLIAKYKLIGMTREEIIELLGPSSDLTSFKEWDFNYILGPEPGIAIDLVWLVIKLQNNRVVKYRIITG